MGQNILGAMGALGGLVLLGLGIAAIVWLAWWMLEPINRAAGSLNAPSRFMLIDVVSLMIMLQVGLAICGQSLSARDAGHFAARIYWVLIAVVALLVVVLWSASVSVVSRAGILRPLRRVLVTVVLVPGTLVTMVGCLPCSEWSRWESPAAIAPRPKSTGCRNNFCGFRSARSALSPASSSCGNSRSGR
jgi:hypothetical protein